jgi:soluble lytic murein transglycosylase-like protein/TolA-binding protein
LNRGKSSHYVRDIMAISATLLAGALAGLLIGRADTTLTVEGPGGAWRVAFGPAVVAEPEDSAAIVQRAAQALAVGAPEQARSLLERYVLPPPSALRSMVYRLYAEATYADSDYTTAARFFAAAAQRAGGPRRGVLEVRAGDAFERAGLPGPAIHYFRAALRRLPEVSGWIAIRLARLVPDTSAAFELLRRAPPPAARLALETRAALLASAGDVATAEAVLAAADRSGLAAQYALAAGDTARAEHLAYDALQGADSEEARASLELLADHTAALTLEQQRSVAGALRQHGRPADAARLLAGIIRGGDSTSGAWLAWGTALEGAGDRQRALRVYAAAGGMGDGPDAASAQYMRARLLLRSGRRAEGLNALGTFVRLHPHHPAVPAALIAIADARLRAGNRRGADSLYQAVARGWSQSPVASEARFRLAGRALQRGDLATASNLYAKVVQEKGPSMLAARYALGRLALQRRDTALAHARWRALAQDDPLGYYGMLAREAAGMEPLAFHDPGPPAVRDPDVDRVTATVALLDAIAFDGEADALVDYATGREDYTADQLLELANGMLRCKRPTVASSLGWRAARTLSLDDPRVLRVIFPWPWRQVIEAEAREFGIDPYLLAAVIRQESGFRSAVVSHAGAWGLMQLMPGTARMVASRLGLPWRERLLTVPGANVHVGAAHLAMLLRRYRGRVARALAAYNAGGRPVARWVRNPGASDAFWFVEEIPYPETRGYVRSVMRNRAVYEALYPGIAVR